MASSHLQGTAAICLSHKGIPLPCQVTGHVFRYLCSTFPVQVPTGSLPSTQAAGHTHDQHVTHIRLRSSDKTRLFLSLSKLSLRGEVSSYTDRFLHCWSKILVRDKATQHMVRRSQKLCRDLCKQSWRKIVWELKMRQWLQFLLPP